MRVVVSRTRFHGSRVDSNKILLKHEKLAQHRAKLPDQRTRSTIFAYL
jgi:hypothetical protein